MAEKNIRLDKLLADMKVGSRSEVKILIRKGRIRVNGEVIRDIGTKVAASDEIAFDGNVISYTAKEYILLNKPEGVITATRDKKQETVLDLIESKRKDLFPVGRLDKDTEGLLLLTNDGNLAHFLLSPKRHIDKTYYAKINGNVTEQEVALFAEGLQVEEDWRAMPAVLKILKAGNESEIELTIREGKFHQVKRMFEAVGMEVTYLKRISMGSLKLDDNLAPGEFRNLTDKELDSLMQCAGMTETEDLLSTALKDKKAAIFDLDGTLIDSMWMWRAIDIEYLGRFGIDLPENLQSEIEGMSFNETADYFHTHFPQITDNIDEMKMNWNAMAMQKYSHEVTLKPGALKFLNYLKDNGFKLGIATSNSMELVTAALKNLKVDYLFDEIHTACEVKAGKPSPDIYLLVAEKMQIKPELCLVFEDICKGIEAGKNAGMTVCAVEDEYSVDTRTEKAELADYYIQDYRDFGFNL